MKLQVSFLGELHFCFLMLIIGSFGILSLNYLYSKIGVWYNTFIGIFFIIGFGVIYLIIFALASNEDSQEMFYKINGYKYKIMEENKNGKKL